MLSAQMEPADSAAPELRVRQALKAVRHALRPGAPPPVLRVHVPLPDQDPWAPLAAADDAGVRWFAWADGASGIELAAWGTATPTPPGGESDAHLTHHSLTCEQVHDLGWRSDADVLQGAPLAVGGFAFAPSGRTTPWHGWPVRSMVIPEFTLLRRRGQVTLIASMSVDETLRASQVLDAVSHARALTTSARPVGGSAPRRVPGPDARDARRWQRAAAEAIEAIHRGALNKVVLARSERWPAGDDRRFDPVTTLHALRQRHPECFTFGLGRPNGQAFVGASPEVLARVDGAQVETVALAGTVPRHAAGASEDDLAGALLDNPKEREEQDLVLEAIRGALDPLCQELHVPETPTIARLTDMQHLATPIRGRLRDGVGLLEVAAVLHPTPAVGGVPRDEALYWIGQAEDFDRGWYAAPVGWIDAAGGGTLAVAIRSALLDGDTAWGFAGAGLVAGSDPEREWRETSLKLNPMRHSLRERWVR